jgi:nucleoside-diphosphate-sugar epimerase
MKSRSVSITGATGFLGWHFAEALRNAGWQVRAIVRPGNRKPLPSGVDSVEASLAGSSSAAALAHAIESSSVVIHAAGTTRALDEAAFQAGNVEATRTVVGAANETRARLVVISSQAAIGAATTERPSRESDQARPLNAYGRTKLAGEEVVRSSARVPWTILRPSAVYGPRDRQFLPLFRLASYGISPLVTAPTTPFTFVHIADLVRAVELASEGDRGAGETLFIGHQTPETSDDLLRYLAGAFGRRYRPIRIPRTLVGLASRVGDVARTFGWQPLIDSDRLVELRAEGFVCAVDRARDVIGFTASIPLRQGVERTAQWYRSQGWV